MSGVLAVVALGSNLGDRDGLLRDAVRDLRAVGGVELVGASAPVESAAVGLEGLDDSKPAYLNGVVLVRTTLSADDLLTELNRIENDHGRVRLERWGDRTLDLDLIVHGDTLSDTERLTLPHPRAAERSFVLQPWLQIDPEARLGDQLVADLLQRLDDPVTPVPGATALDGPVLDAPAPAPAVPEVDRTAPVTKGLR